jgi:ABC-type nitrate/sulfonate/bicarbonate transport system permease component
MLIESLNFSADVAGVFSILFIRSGLGLLLNYLIAMLRRRVLFWDASMKTSPEDIRRREIA